MNAHRIMVVEDDSRLAAGIVRGLREAELDVVLATRGDHVLEQLETESPDLLILDLMLPGRSGFEVLADLQRQPTCPVIVLTARGDLDTRLRCFQLGASDYVAKPFYMEELVARVHARLEPPEPEAEVVSFGAVTVDISGRTVSVDGSLVPLTRHEMDILVYLLQRPGDAVSRRQLIDGAMPGFADRDPRTVDSHVGRVRRKLGADGAAIVTVWGIGYRFDPAAA